MKSHEEVITVDGESSRCRCNRCICCSHCYYRLSILLLSQLTSYQHEALKCHESQHFTWFARYKWCIWFTQTQAWIWFWNSKAFKRRGFRSIRFPRGPQVGCTHRVPRDSEEDFTPPGHFLIVFHDNYCVQQRSSRPSPGDTETQSKRQPRSSRSRSCVAPL